MHRRVQHHMLARRIGRRYDSKLWMPGLIEGAAYLPK
jgi:hypothetical protein